MLRPAMNEIIGKNDSYYAMVIGIAKRARQIADDLYEHEQKLEEKPVKTAVEEFAAKKFKIVEPSSNNE